MNRILIVDDEKSIRITLKVFLSDAGYDVEIAEDTEQAIVMIEKNKFDVVVTDLIMPRLTGMGLLKVLKKRSPDSKVIMMNREPTSETAEESSQFGVFEYVLKPIGKDKILKTVKKALRSRS